MHPEGGSWSWPHRSAVCNPTDWGRARPPVRRCAWLWQISDVQLLAIQSPACHSHWRLRSQLFTMHSSLLASHAGSGPTVPSAWHYHSGSFVGRAATHTCTCSRAQGPRRVSSLTSAHLLIECLCGPQTAALSPGRLVLHAPFPKKHKVCLGQGWPQPARASNSFR